MDDAQAKTEMVYGKLKNVELYDPCNIGVYPKGVAENSNFGDFIKRASTIGDGFLLHGETIKKQSDGTDQIIGYTTILANLSESRDIKTTDRWTSQNIVDVY